MHIFFQLHGSKLEEKNFQYSIHVGDNKTKSSFVGPVYAVNEVEVYEIINRKAYEGVMVTKSQGNRIAQENRNTIEIEVRIENLEFEDEEHGEPVAKKPKI